MRAFGREPFAAILPVLEADRPLNEYGKILTEIDRRRPDPMHSPLRAAVAARGWLMIRIGLETGLRSKNLRQLLVRDKGQGRTPQARLKEARRGELYWSADANDGAGGWEIFIPRQAFKNANSSFWAHHDYENTLADVGGLYARLQEYLGIHRPNLLAGRESQMLFVMDPEGGGGLEMQEWAFYAAWRHVIERYGIYNPWTGRGAIPGLRGHGPHAGIRDVLATHVLKVTGSVEDAAAAIQDTPAAIAYHYARWIPRDRIMRIKPVITAALAAD